MHNISAWDLAIASILVCISLFISTLLRLGLTKQIIIAALRTVIQLSAIGMILKYIFATDDPQWIMVIVLIMTLVAGFSAGGRSRYHYQGLRYDALLAVWLTSWLVACIGLYLVLRIEPWHSPQFVIPILGMILGNTLNAVALTFNRITQALADQRSNIEMYLSLGATPWEAFRSLARQSISAGMLPTINSMTVVGIVSLPGMMTGQILAGGDPEQAVRYQIIVMFFLCAAAALGSMLAVWFTFKRFFDKKSCFLYQRLITKSHRE
ncbi:putative ABC transport system permease protein [Volucribacter psittacicida]|uniref:Putative ABC transport system permease protein n=1 Tax=Volucribacter psittacicida TaxID=203482 RepID=A0A4R1G5F8_9PAST|nr:iron export ABC transporter permease subunit FetB [Volucribacter psittacicida]TCJ98951.1 putative ABC transport system permease protein [Volucribacter psittacicida]